MTAMSQGFVAGRASCDKAEPLIEPFQMVPPVRIKDWLPMNVPPLLIKVIFVGVPRTRDPLLTGHTPEFVPFETILRVPLSSVKAVPSVPPTIVPLFAERVPA